MVINTFYQEGNHYFIILPLENQKEGPALPNCKTYFKSHSSNSVVSNLDCALKPSGELHKIVTPRSFTQKMT